MRRIIKVIYIVFGSYKFFFKQQILLLVNIFYLGQCRDKVTFLYTGVWRAREGSEGLVNIP